MAVKLMIDSATDINKEEAEKLGIYMVPMVITFGDEDFYDGVDLLPEGFYEKLINNDKLPSTSQINPYRWEEEFAKYTNNGDELVVITISSKLSGTYNSACQAAEKFKDKVYVVDSLSACIGERLLAMYALKLIEENKSAKEIADTLNQVKYKIEVMAMIDTLKFLKKGGRLSAATAFAGELLNLKPIVAVKDGEVVVIDKAMGIKKGMAQLNKIAQEKGGIDLDMPYGLIWSGLDKSNLEKYQKESASLFPENAIVPSYILGGTIGTHIGPGAIGISFFTK